MQKMKIGKNVVNLELDWLSTLLIISKTIQIHLNQQHRNYTSFGRTHMKGRNMESNGNKIKLKMISNFT